MNVHQILVLLSLYAVSNSSVFSHRLDWLFHVEEDTEGPVCDTEYCVKTANEFLDSMNQSVDPCDNFYEYTCGRFEESHEGPLFTATWSRLQMFQALVSHRLKKILEVKAKPTDLLPVRQAKKFYRSCIDTDVLEQRGLAPLESILMRTGGWPMTMDPEEWDADEYSWQTVEHYYFHITGSYVLYKFDSYGYSEDQYFIILPGGFPLQETVPLAYENYRGNENGDYINAIVQVAKIVIKHSKSHVSEEMLYKDAEDLVEFEKQLSQIKEQAEWNNYDRISLANFTDWYNNEISDADIEHKINFRQLLQTLLELINVDVEDSMKLVVQERQYFINLTELLNQTPSRTIVNYIHWHFVSEIIKYTTEEMRDVLFSMMGKQYGITERKPRWLECLEQTQLTEVAAYTFMENYFTEETKNNMIQLKDQIRDGMATVINTSDLMLEEEREQLQNKLREIKFLVGFPEWYSNKTAIVNSFRGLSIGSDFMDNILSYRRYALKKLLRNTVLADENTEDFFRWSMDAITVNALYGGEVVEVPAADFQPPLFTPRFPQSINYGMTGVILGHEIGHGYDSTYEFKFQNNNQTISNSTEEKFINRAECFETQIREMVTSPVMINKDLVPLHMIQTIADASGLQSSFIAYRTLMEQNGGVDTTLPGFEKFSHEQMFFIAFGGMWCESNTKEMAKKMEEQGRINPGRQRVLSGVSNNEDFRKAFNCPKGSAMNRENRCNIWKEI